MNLHHSQSLLVSRPCTPTVPSCSFVLKLWLYISDLMLIQSPSLSPSVLPSMLLSVHPASRHSDGGGKVIYSLSQDTASTSIYSTPTLFWRPHQYQAGAWVVISSICKCLVKSEMTRTMERHTSTSSTVYRDIKNPTHYRIPLTHTLHTKREKNGLWYTLWLKFHCLHAIYVVFYAVNDKDWNNKTYKKFSNIYRCNRDTEEYKLANPIANRFESDGRIFTAGEEDDWLWQSGCSGSRVVLSVLLRTSVSSPLLLLPWHDIFVRNFFFSLSVTPTAREKGANPLNLQVFLLWFCPKCNLIFM